MRLFRKKSQIEKLDRKYQALLKESHSLSKSNRLESDKKAAEANRVLEEILRLEKAQSN